jgi:hypothetical protein
VEFITNENNQIKGGKDMYAVTIYNLNTSQKAGIYICNPRDAVMAAYAQNEHKDFNTWAYERRYGSLVRYGKYTISCGDYCVLKCMPSHPDIRINRPVTKNNLTGR